MGERMKNIEVEGRGGGELTVRLFHHLSLIRGPVYEVTKYLT